LPDPHVSNLTPYITPVEFINAPLGVDWSSIPSRGSSTPNAEQEELCWRVTDRMDQIAEQVLRASVVVQQERGPDFTLTVDRWTMEGRLRAAQWPILQVVSGQWCYSAAAYPPTWNQIAQNQFQIDDLTGFLGSPFPQAARGSQYINIAPGVLDWAYGRNGYRMQVKYIAGNMLVCGINASGSKPNGPAASDTSIHVDDITGWGILSGTAGRIRDGALTEPITVTSVTPDTTGAISGPGLLNLAAGLANAHALGVRISHQPNNLQQAAFYLAVAYARIRGATAIAPKVVGGGGGASVSATKSVEELIVEAEEILATYKVVIV
jgi:hypothetical protein